MNTPPVGPEIPAEPQETSLPPWRGGRWLWRVLAGLLAVAVLLALFLAYGLPGMSAALFGISYCG